MAVIYQQLKYEAVAGSRLSNNDAEKIGPELVRIAETPTTELPAEVVVEAAREASSPLHSYFEWNDTIAAEMYRLDQARYLIRSIVITEVDNKRLAAPVRAFVSIKLEEEPAHNFHITNVKANPMMVRQVLNTSWQEIISWRNRAVAYEEFFEEHPAHLERVVALIDAIQEEIRAAEDR